MATELQTQVVREAPDIEAAKLGLMESAKSQVDAINAAAQEGRFMTPDYQVAGMSQNQLDAIGLGQAGINAYQPYLTAAGQGVMSGYGTTGQALSTMQGADTRGQFETAQQALAGSQTPIGQMAGAAELTTAGLPSIAQGSAGLGTAQQMAAQYAQGNLGQAQDTLGAAEQAAMAARPTDFSQAQGTLGQGIGSLQGAAGMYNPASVQGFMNPYQQQVIDEAMRQINRQNDIAMQGVQAQGVRAGAFGGSRDALQRAEMNREFAGQRNAAIVGALQQGYQNAAQQAQSAFEQQQQRQLAQAQGLQNAAALQGQFGSMAQQQALQQAAALQGIGSIYGQQALQQAQLGQGAANLMGSAAAQQAQLANLYGNLGAQQANIYGQQAQLEQQLGLGMGSMAAQQFGIGSQLAQGIGSLGAQQAAMGMNAAQLGQAAQAMGQQDVNFLYNLGTAEQRQQQAVIDAARQNQLQQNMQPLQMMGYLSDIYRGAPSTSMAMTQQSQPTASPFQQLTGLALGTAGALGAANKSGII